MSRPRMTLMEQRHKERVIFGDVVFGDIGKQGDGGV